MARDNGLCVCVVKPHGVSDKPLGEAILQCLVSPRLNLTPHGIFSCKLKKNELSGSRDVLRLCQSSEECDSETMNEAPVFPVHNGLEKNGARERNYR
jgi:hypothetical protein